MYGNIYCQEKSNKSFPVPKLRNSLPQHSHPTTADNNDDDDLFVTFIEQNRMNRMKQKLVKAKTLNK